MKEPTEVTVDGRTWTVWDVELFKLAYLLAKKGAHAIGAASKHDDYYPVPGMKSLGCRQRQTFIRDARRIVELLRQYKGAA